MITLEDVEKNEESGTGIQGLFTSVVRQEKSVIHIKQKKMHAINRKGCLKQVRPAAFLCAYRLICRF